MNRQMFSFISMVSLLTISQSASPQARANTVRQASREGVLIAADYVGIYNNNAHSNDATYWSRSSKNLYLSLSMIESINPGDRVQISLTDNNGRITNDLSKTVQWYCNSPDVKWTPMYSNMETEFQASKPGIYTIQARVNKEYSVPLVLVVGLSKLRSRPIPLPEGASGVKPLPSKLINELPSVANTWEKNMTVTPWASQGGWVPVSGRTNAVAQSMFIEMYSTTIGKFWTYQIPVENHQFAALLRSPSIGTMRVFLIPDYLKTADKQTSGVVGSSFSPTAFSTYLVRVGGSPPPKLEQSIWASAWFDYNMNSEFNSVASTLVENSPSLETAIEAISNTASTDIRYNYAEFNSHHSLYQDATMTLDLGMGICTNYSTVEETFLNSVGIPTQVLSGTENSSGIPYPHAWNRVWNGSKWQFIDTTLDNIHEGGLSNAFFGDTSELLRTHQLNPGSTSLNLPTPSWQ